MKHITEEAAKEMAQKQQHRSASDAFVSKRMNDGQGSYRGFLMIRCEECGEVTAYNARFETFQFRCDHCGNKTALENLRPLYLHCMKCGGDFRYKTNITGDSFRHKCLRCDTEVPLELNGRGTAYVTVGVRK